MRVVDRTKEQGEAAEERGKGIVFGKGSSTVPE